LEEPLLQPTLQHLPEVITAWFQTHAEELDRIRLWLLFFPLQLQLLQAAQEAVSTLEERVTASQLGALDISKKAMSFAERNVLSAFEFAQNVVQTKDIQELVRMQNEFVQSQMQALSEQVKDLGEVSKAAMDSKKSSKTGGVSS